MCMRSDFRKIQSRKKPPAKFGDTCSVRNDGVCIGCLGGGQNERGSFFFTTNEF